MALLIRHPRRFLKLTFCLGFAALLLILICGIALGPKPAAPSADLSLRAPDADLAALADSNLVEGWIAVDFIDGTTKARYDEIERAWGIDVEFNSLSGAQTGITLGKVSRADMARLLAIIRTHPEVERAEPLVRYQANFTPNDPRHAEQWNFDLIDMKPAWDLSRGEGATVAVVDTGIAHRDAGEFRVVPDLKGARFAAGYDFVNDDDHADDDHGHGTHVAGTIAQRTNNGEGVAGIAFEATLMPIKVLDMNGMGNSADIAEAIRWAADHGAQVINLSLGGGGYSSIMADAVARARRKGVLVVCAAGNDGMGKVSYPAAYPGALAVSAVGPSGALASYSNFGPQIALAAPGGDIRRSGDVRDGILQNTLRRDDVGRSDYVHYQGTSMATPHVSGVAALLFAAGARSADEVERALFKGARRDPSQEGAPSPDATPRVSLTSVREGAGSATTAHPGFKDPALGRAAPDSNRFGHGLVNAAGALQALGAPMQRSTAYRVVALILALGLFTLVLVSFSPDRRPRAALSLPLALGLLLATVGVACLPATGGLSQISLPLPLAMRPLWGGLGISVLSCSALGPFALGLFCFARKSAWPKQLLVGLSLGFTAVFLMELFRGTTLKLLPWWPLSALWLAINALFAWLLARTFLSLLGGRR